MEEKAHRVSTEVQLGFAFFTDTASPVATPSHEGSDAPHEVQAKPRRSRNGITPRNLGDMLTMAHTVLLESSIEDINAHLLSVFEFCEAALTRALDVVPMRQDILFSEEEYRSLRGIGQAQWMLAEEQGKREAKPAVARVRKSKKEKSEA